MKAPTDAVPVPGQNLLGNPHNPVATEPVTAEMGSLNERGNGDAMIMQCTGCGQRNRLPAPVVAKKVVVCGRCKRPLFGEHDSPSFGREDSDRDGTDGDDDLRGNGGNYSGAGGD